MANFNQKRQAPPKSTPGKGPGNNKQPVKQASNPAPKSEHKPKDECPRCYNEMLPGWTTNHRIDQCSKALIVTVDKRPDLWNSAAATGTETDTIANMEDALLLLSSPLLSPQPQEPTDFKGKPITKYLLESAFILAVRDNTASAPPIVPGLTSTSVQGSSGPTQPQRQPLTATRPFKLDDPPQHLKQEDCPRDFDYAVHDQCVLDGSLIPKKTTVAQLKRKVLKPVATNYVAVRSVPSQLHMYSLEYGNIQSVKTDHQKDMDKKHDGTGDSNHPVPNLAGLSIGDGRKPTQRSEKSRIFKALNGRPELHGIQWSTDYELFWSTKKLPSEHRDGHYDLPNVQYTKLSGRKCKLNTLTFNFCRSLKLGNNSRDAAVQLLQQEPHPNASSVSDRAAPLRITALNALVTKEMSRNDALIPVGPNKFFTKERSAPMDPLRNIRHGYSTSIRPGEGSVLLNINVATSAFYNPITLDKVFSACKRPQDAKSLLKGLMVWIGYKRQASDPDPAYDLNADEHRHRIVAGFGKVPADQTFEKDGVSTTVAQYFDGLGHKVTHHDLPCISVNVAPSQQGQTSSSSKPSPQWILPELLFIEPYQVYGKLLPPALTEKMITEAVRAPSVNQHKILTEGFKLLGIGQPESVLRSLPMDIGSQLLKVPAVLLDTPSIQYRQEHALMVREPKTASWDLRDIQFFTTPASAVSRPVATIDLRCNGRGADRSKLGVEISMNMQGHGILFAQQQIDFETPHASLVSRNIDWTNDQNFGKTLVAEFKRQQYLPDPKLTVVILDAKDIERYGVVKRFFDQRLGVHTVCVTETKLKKKTPSLLSNLSLKFNMKMRGENHQVCLHKSNTSAFSSISEGTIVFGADVSHAGSEMPNTPSVASVVASEDGRFFRFSASMRLQRSKTEMIEELDDMVRYRLRRYHELNDRLPSRVIFFRDGVGEDQFEICKRSEISQIETAYATVAKEIARQNGNTAPAELRSLTFIVAGKRHNTRFYAASEDQTYKNYDDTKGMLMKNPKQVKRKERDPSTGKEHAVWKDTKLNGNIAPGLLVENVVTRPKTGEKDEIFDFFLQSHAALQGTARACHYTVLQQGDLNVQQIQELTHAFCYNYGRATKGVSYAGPAYYADRLCERGTHYLKAFTRGRTTEPIGMTDNEIAMPGKSGQEAFARRVAKRISGTPAWNLFVNNPKYKDREPNPWHPNFDNTMFWL